MSVTWAQSLLPCGFDGTPPAKRPTLRAVVDLVIGFTIIATTLGGLRAGSLRSLWSLIGFVISLLFAIVVQFDLAGSIVEMTGIPAPTARGIALLLGLLLSYVIYVLAAKPLLVPAVRFVRQHEALSALERGFGVLPSALHAILICAAAIVILVLFTIGDVRSQLDESRLAREIVTRAYAIQPSLSSFVTSTEERPLFQTIIVTSGTRRSLDIPDGLSLSTDADAEAMLLRLLNDDRVVRGLPTVALDARASVVARRHSAEMFRLRYLGHISPLTGSDVDRLDNEGVTYGRSAEAIAFAPLALTAHLGLMSSRLDRLRLLDPAFTRVGIGVIAAEPYGFIVTEVFLAVP